jgi:tRNA pseudouridine38-40 synthase
MARYQVILAYDGAGFSGSQRQSAGSGSPQGVPGPHTVQGELENALRKIGWIGKSALLAGRTDAGVHASGQVAAFDFDEWAHSAEKLLKALNAELPPDLAVRSLRPAKADFHPRFGAVSRTYRYRLFCDPLRDPLRERFAWRVASPLDGDALEHCAQIFLGTHDFAAFGSPTSERGTTIRTVTKSEWRKKPHGEWQFEVRADAFLYRMVRRLVFVQVSLAQGSGSVGEVRRALSKRGETLPRASRGVPAGLAPAHGLTLVKVSYGSQTG